LKAKQEIEYSDRLKIKYPDSLEKILRMYNRAIQDGFTSFAELPGQLKQNPLLNIRECILFSAFKAP